ncbi:MAG: 30S ribosomal protein S7 [Chloroflexi bacterium]|nr:30S ribosomal protein S7 [Chloroflexota bacterium]
MPRRARVIRRVPPSDAKYGNATIARLTNKVMSRGKKSVAEKIIYGALDIIQSSAKGDPVAIFEQAIKNAMPALEVRPRRVGGATYQVPVEVHPRRASTLAIRWVLAAARSRNGRSMAQKLAAEIQDAARGQGVAIKKREDTHRMAEANRAFVHYRW